MDHILAAWLPTALKNPVSKAKARKLIVAGAVYLNGKRVSDCFQKSCMPGAQIDVYVDLRKLFEEDGRARDRSLFEMRLPNGSCLRTSS